MPCRPATAKAIQLRIRDLCSIQTVVKVFQLQPDYTPGKSFWSTNKPVDLLTGRGISFMP